MSDDLPTNLRPIADFFGLVGTSPVRKDFHVVRAIGVMAAFDAAPFNLVFCGGTAVARAHKLVRRMSEDVDFKVVLPPAIAMSNSQSLEQTAAEKLVSLTRRIAMERAGISRAPDPTLVRHIYDLHALRAHVDPGAVSALARAAATADAIQFRNQDPAYVADIAGVTRDVLVAIQTDPVYRSQYYAFMAAMVYGERPEFDVALSTVVALASRALM